MYYYYDTPFLIINRNNVIKVYTDGGFRPKYKLGAYAYVMLMDEKILEYSIAVQQTSIVKVTNNIMEMKAVIKAFDKLLKNSTNSNHDVYLITDSQYVQLGLSKWYQSWSNNNWKSSSGKRVKNLELWHLLHDKYKKCQRKFNTLSIQWVEGHSNNPMNDKVDGLCNTVMDAHILKINKDEI